MPFKNGIWEPEDDSVTVKLTGLMNQNSPYMQQAKTMAKQGANQRGLLNSSMAAGAGVDAAIKSALPIASQEASQTTQKNLTSMGLGSQEKIAQMNVGAHDRQYAMSSLADMNKTYAAAWSETMKNKDLDASSRTNYYNHLKALADKNVGLVEQMYNIKLNW